MADLYLNVHELPFVKEKIITGDRVYLSGTVYTARDAAHSALVKMLDNGERLPFDINGAVIYYAGPTPTNESGRIGSFGPTTSSRMDGFTPRLLDEGLSAMIGKGNRSTDVINSIIKNKALYFCAGGGLGALISKSIISSDVIAFPELGCESIKKLQVLNMPLVTAIDCYGTCIFDR